MKMFERTAGWLFLFMITGCAASEIKPVDIYPEDNCSYCRMAVSDKAFASEIITADDDVLKFDDLGCQENYRKNNPAIRIKTAFVTDYETKSWIPYERSVIVRTDLATPMGSGKVAFSDSTRALKFAKEHPPKELAEGDGCGGDCCN